MSDNKSYIEPLLTVENKWQYSYEQPISYAPLIQLANNRWVVPQHFLRYKHTLKSVNTVLENIEFSTHFTVLAAQKNGQIYLQVAVLSPDNYTSAAKAKKLLFGRRWIVEANLPTSELIQTAFLALKLAREHEVRELFKLQHTNAFSTPFNNHHDLPLMAQNPELVNAATANTSVSALIKRLEFSAASVELITEQKLNERQYLYSVKLLCSDCQLNEFNESTVSFLTTDNDSNSFMHGLITALVAMSNHYVSEQFKYQGLARFSNQLNAEQVGELSIAMRSPEGLGLCSMGKHHANQLNFEIDSGRAPEGCGQEIGGFLAAHGIEQPENAHLYTNRF
jgi:hypothetical protein